MNHMLFEDILSQIYDTNIKKFTIECLKKAPAELDKIPASTSGKYHPAECCVEGGLVAHICRACFFASIFIKSHNMENSDIKGDVLIASVLLHDIGKKGDYGRNFKEYVNHPIVAANMISEFANLVPNGIFKAIQNCIRFHMGPWTPESIKKPMSEYTMLELLTYYSDYYASQKTLTITRS